MNFVATSLNTNPIDSESDLFLQEALSGLKQHPKSLPSKYFYDAIGSRIFEEICELEEYYVTRTELNILHQYRHEMAAYFDSEMTVIEPGAGAGIKVSILLEAMDKPKKFIPLEISCEAISMSSLRLKQQHPTIEISPLQGDFTNTADLQRVAQLFNKDEKRLVFFPGSTLGNFSHPEALQILKNLKILAGNEGNILLGVDLIKDRNRLVAAYNDKQGVTARFNLNLLARMNKELGSNFDLHQGFIHKAIFNEQYRRIEMHLVATRDQVVTLASERILFKKGETIHTENAHKYSVSEISRLSNTLDMTIQHYWQDNDQDFALFLLTPIKHSAGKIGN